MAQAVPAPAPAPNPVPTEAATGIVSLNSIDFIAQLFALGDAGKLAVPLRDAGDALRIAAAGVGEIVTPALAHGWMQPRFAPRDDAALAQLVFSSGTTGAAKAIALRHANIADTTRRLIAAQGLDAGVREYVGVPVTYSFGLGRARAIGAVGGALYLPPHGFDPGEIAAMLAAGEINAIAAVPTLWRLLLGNAERLRDHGAKLRWIEIGSQPMARAEKEALKALFPAAAIVQHYGLTEASRTTFLRIDQAEGAALDSVGGWTAPVEVRLDADAQILVRGPHVAAGRWQDGALLPLTDADGWLATGDLGAIVEGRLQFRGRIDDQINCGGIKLDADALEAAISADLGIGGIGAGGIGVTRIADALRGDGVLVAYEAGAGLSAGLGAGPSADAVMAAARRVTEGFGLHAGGAVHVLAVERLPRTETGKLQRHLLAAGLETAADLPLADRLVGLWARILDVQTVTPHDNFFDLGGDPLLGHALIAAMESAGVSAAAAAGLWDGASIADIVARDAVPAASGDSAQDRILAIWRSTLGRDDVSLHEGFYDVGGDSLSAITLALSMERAGFDPELARAIFDGKTVAEIAAQAAAAAEPGAGAQAPGDAAPPVRSKAQVALLSEGLNLVKGILVLAMIASHWVPIYLGYFGLRGGLISKTIEPVLTMGSPTLAFIFGIGIAVFQLRQYASSGAAFRSNIAKGALLLAVGLVVGTVLESFAVRVNTPDFGPAHVVLAATDGPFAYYLLATLAIPLWIGGLRRDLVTVQRLFGAALLSYAVYLLLWKLLLPAEPAGILAQALRALLVGHWGLFQLGALTLAGTGTGLLIELHLRRSPDAGKLVDFRAWGWMLIAAGLILSVAANDFGTWFVPHESITLWSALLYAGVALVIIARFEALDRWMAPHPLVRTVVQLVTAFGILLFPLYVLQSLVYHSTYLLHVATGVSLIKLLTLCITLFLIAAAYPVWRVWRLYYADRS